MPRWMMRLMSPDGDDGGGGGDPPENDAGGNDVTPPDVFSMSLGDATTVPEKFRGKPVAELLKAHNSAEKAYSKAQARIKELEAAGGGEGGGGEFDQQVFRELLDTGRVSGEADSAKVEAAAELLGIRPSDVQRFVAFAHQEYTGVITEAQTMLDAKFAESQGGSPKVEALLAWANDEKNIDDQRRAVFNLLLNDGSLEPFNLILKQMEAKGVDPLTLKQGTAGGPNDLPLPRRGHTDSAPAGEGYKTRAEYQKALAAAGNDPVAKEEVFQKMKKSDRAKWEKRPILT